MRYLAILLLAAPLFAAIDGTVINKSTSRPQAGVTVSLSELGQGGMTPAGSAKTDANGKFQIEGNAQSAHLLQAIFQGVTYNMQISPGSTSALEVFVYNASAQPVATKVDQHMVLLETDGQELVVNETLIYKNDGTSTWSNPSGGTLKFYLPEAAQQQMRVRATAPNGMPVERTALKAGQKNVYYVDYPVRPGETRFDISYKMPVKDPVVFASRAMHSDAKVKFVVPQGIKAEGAGLKALGQEPTTQASIFEAEGRDYQLKLAGAGSLRQAQVEPTERSEEDGPRIESIQPRIYSKMSWILGLSLTVLAIGFYTLFAKGSAPRA